MATNRFNIKQGNSVDLYITTSAITLAYSLDNYEFSFNAKQTLKQPLLDINISNKSNPEKFTVITGSVTVLLNANDTNILSSAGYYWQLVIQLHSSSVYYNANNPYIISTPSQYGDIVVTRSLNG